MLALGDKMGEAEVAVSALRFARGEEQGGLAAGDAKVLAQPQFVLGGELLQQGLVGCLVIPLDVGQAFDVGWFFSPLTGEELPGMLRA